MVLQEKKSFEMSFGCRVIAGIDDSGTKVDRKNYRSKVGEKLETLLDAYESYQADEEPEDIDIDGDLEEFNE